MQELTIKKPRSVGSTYLIVVQDEPETQVGKIQIPEKTARRSTPNYGRVLAVGKYVDEAVEGDRVCFHSQQVYPSKLDDGTKVLVMKQDAILFVV